MASKNCKNCNYYTAYYTKSYDHFNETRYGLCKKSSIEKRENCSCEFWKDDSGKREVSKSVSLETLQKACEYIRDIRQILIESSKTD